MQEMKDNVLFFTGAKMYFKHLKTEWLLKPNRETFSGVIYLYDSKVYVVFIND